MGIQKDAGELLMYVYEKYIESSRSISTNDVINEIGWKATRMNNAIQYLRDLDILKIVYLSGNTEGMMNFIIYGLHHSGVDIIENKDKFNTTFGFEVGVPGFFKFSWTQEKKH